MKLRKTIIAVATAAALAVSPTSIAFAGGRSNDCRDGEHWKDYKYSAQCECDHDHDHDHDYDHDYDKDKDKDRDNDHRGNAKPLKAERPSSRDHRVLATN